MKRTSAGGGDGSVATTTVQLPADCPRFHGHFPGAPIFPAIATLQDLVLPFVERTWPELVSVSAIPRMKLARPIRPLAELTIRVARAPESNRVDFVVSCGPTVCGEGALEFRGPA